MRLTETTTYRREIRLRRQRCRQDDSLLTTGARHKAALRKLNNFDKNLVRSSTKIGSAILIIQFIKKII